jgi:hypothetical protein
MNKFWRRVLLFPLAILMGIDGDVGGADAGSGDSSAGDDSGNSDAGTDPGAGQDGSDNGEGSIDPASPEGIAKAEADAKIADQAKLVGAPEAYEAIKLPEGTEVPEGFMDLFNPIAKDFNLSQEGAQKLFDRLATDLQPKILAAQNEKWEGIKQTWSEQTKVDKEIGGVNFDDNVAVAQRALNTFGTPELRQALSDYGMGNHPEMVRLMLRIGKSMREDSVIHPDVSTDTSGEKAKLKGLYPTMDK